jgi:signal transduction histidine kinase
MNPFHFLKRSLRKRIILLVGLGMLGLAAILLFSNLWQSRELSSRAMSERLRLAQALASHLDYILKYNLTALQDVALGARQDLNGVDMESLKVALRKAHLGSIFTQGVFLTGRSGELIWIEPQNPSRVNEDFSSILAVRQTLEIGKPAVSDLVSDTGKRIYAAVPVRDWHGDLVGVVGGEMDPESPRFSTFLHTQQLGGSTYIEIVDSLGIVLASTKPGRAYVESDHGSFLASLIQDKRSVVGTCHGCHEGEGLAGRERELIAFAPLTFAHWGVSIRQTEREALAPAFTIRQRFWFVASLAILLGLVFAWGVARSVAKPLGILTQAAQRITQGDLNEPIPPLGEDEMGRLSRSLDQMRITLRDSLSTIAEGKEDLERKVQERTRELEILYHELQIKEGVRGELLKKVITAQEEERKRIARELHDETSQALSALLLSIETGFRAAPEHVKKPLDQVKAMANRILDDVHRLIFDLRPSILDDLGLAAAVRWSGESRLESMGVDLSFEVIGSERRLTPEIETTLFRIAQEAISNIVRHAEAEAVLIKIEFGDEVIRLLIEDDGKGFDAGEAVGSVQGTRGIGLLGLNERAALLDGTVRIHSEPGKGTRVHVEVPLPFEARIETG